MKYIRDTTGRFSLRPYYEQTELDYECEQIIAEFMRKIYGDLILPIPTEALTKLIEQDAADLDLYADLSEESPGVQGVTDFYGYPLKAGHYVPQRFQAPETAAASDGHARRF